MRLSEGLVTILLILAVAGFARAQTTTGSILGDITDPSGAVLPGVTVRVTSTTTGATRETVTNATGAYRFAGLLPAEYAVTVTLDGFRSATRSGVVLPVLGEIKIDFRMEVGQVTESITVTGEAPLVQPTAHVTQTVIDNVRVQALPLRTRDYMDLALLSPGVVLDQSSVRNGSTDSISFFGMEESHKTIWLDGVDFNDEVTGGGTNISASTRTRLNLGAVQEFQVMTSGYSAEFGRSGSGVINVVLKSGGNEVHGDAFYFLRDDAFDKPAFQLRSGVPTQDGEVPPFQRQQYGGTVGGPIVRDNAFYFLSVERQTSDESAQVVIPGEVRTFVESLNMGYNTASVVPRTREQVNTVGKLSVNLNDSNTLHVTYLYDDDNDVNKNVGGSFAADHGFDDLNSSHFGTVNWTSLIGTDTVNELRVNRSSQSLFRSVPEGSLFLPTLEFPSVDIGTDGSSTPQGRGQKNWIIANTTTHQLGNHTLKWGGEMNDIVATNETDERFNGVYEFETDTAPFTPIRYTAGFNLQFARGDSPDPTFTTIRRDMDMYALFVNDTWRVRPNLTFNMGLRYDLRVLEGDLGGPDAFEQPGFSRDNPEDVWLNVALGPSGVIGVQPWRPVPTDTRDFSPRVGLSWDVMGTGKAVVRASYGIFHDRVQTLSLRGTVNGYNGLNVATVQLANPDFFPLVPDAADLPTRAVNVSTVPSPEAHTPYTQQSTAGVQVELAPTMAFSADFTHILGLNFLMSQNVNVPFPSLPGEAQVCPFGEALQQRGFSPCFQMRMLDLSNRMQANSLSLRLDRRFAGGFGFLVGYTLGSVKQFNRGAFGVQPSDPFDKHGDIHFGPTDNDVRHRFTGNIFSRLPYDINVSAIVTANSAGPYDHTTGRDDNRDFVRNDRPPGVGVNALRGDGFFQADLRLAKTFVLDETKGVEVLWEMFNLFNTANLANFNGNQSSSEATRFKARAALTPFQAQLGIRFTF